MSQSPSLRGSGRFPCTASGYRLPGGCLNPLHCGAVVASPERARRLQNQIEVSIPFIAGQWSLRAESLNQRLRNILSQSPSLRGSGRFPGAGPGAREARDSLNPLHCGAVVASRKGSRPRTRYGCLNPLHCGAVVASLSNPFLLDVEHTLVSIPFIAGQWSLRDHRGRQPRRRRSVSIPFIAGQWSLRSARSSERLSKRRRSQSPSLRGSGRFLLPFAHLRLISQVSIPFIAGQWSLRGATQSGARRGCASQSPSLRGSGRFDPALQGVRLSLACLNPLHCGAVVASVRLSLAWGVRGRVSIPFIAGQWSLRGAGPPPGRRCQARLNPLHCGAVVASSRFSPTPPPRPPGLNPLHCGAVVAS